MAKKKTDPSTYFYVALQPSWFNLKSNMSYFDDDFMKIILFYVVYSPCESLSNQSKTLQYYGWKDKPWQTNRYLKDKLDSGVFLNKNADFSCARVIPDLSSSLRKANLDKDTFYKDINHERAAFLNTDGSAYISLFHHIRCSLAHGRFTICKDSKTDDCYFIMENGVRRGSYFQLKARIVLKKSTLVKWIDIISNGPKDDEKQYYYDVYDALSRNNKLRIKDLMRMFGETQYAIEKAIKVLKQANIIEYKHIDFETRYWEINTFNAKKFFNENHIK